MQPLGLEKNVFGHVLADIPDEGILHGWGKRGNGKGVDVGGTVVVEFGSGMGKWATFDPPTLYKASVFRRNRKKVMLLCCGRYVQAYR